jgi:glycosyltransferase involved in cell wall biosynthesis
MNALDVLVHPTTSLEAFGLVVVEALAAGRPVIASRRDGLVEGFDDGVHGLYLPPGDVPALASGMTALLLDPALRARLGEAGARHVRKAFGADAMARRTRAVYGQVLEG